MVPELDQQPKSHAASANLIQSWLVNRLSSPRIAFLLHDGARSYGECDGINVELVLGHGVDE